MADPDASWMLDDDVTFDSAPADEEAVEAADSEAVKVADAPKPPAEWRTTYKLAVSNYNIIQYNTYDHFLRFKPFYNLFFD